MTINYTLKVNERALGSPQPLVESYTVGIVGSNTTMPDFIKLIEIPVQEDPSSVVIPGYVETTGIFPSVTNQFIVNYLRGYIQFHPSANGAVVSVSYKGRGSEVDAVDVNELQYPVGLALNWNGTLSPGVVIPSSISSLITDDFVFPNNVEVTNNLKIDVLSPNTALVSDASNNVVSSLATDVEVGYLVGVTSGIQGQIDGKEPTQIKGDISEVTSSVLTISNGLSSTVGPDVSIEVKQASSTQDGYLSSADWSTFDNKQDVLAFPINVDKGGTGESSFPLGVLKSDGVGDGNLSASSIVDGDISLTAAIVTSKLADASKFLLSDANKTLTSGVRYSYTAAQTFSNNYDLVTKQYVDSVAQGLDIHQEVHLKVTSAELPAFTATGANATKALTANVPEAFPLLQSYLLNLNEALLLSDSPTTFDDGIYYLFNAGVDGVKASGTITVNDYTLLALVTVTVDGTPLVEGTDWFATTSNDATATSLAAAIDALTNVNASALTNVVTVEAAVAGIAGNSIGMVSTDNVNLTLSGAILAGGVDAVSWVLKRRSEEDGSPSNEVVPGDFFFVAHGTYEATGWVVTGTGDLDTDGEIDIDNGDKFTVTQFSGAGTYVAGTGLTLSGNEFKVSDAVAGQLLIGQGLGTDTSFQTMSGDATLAADGEITIAANAITNGKLDALSVTDDKIDSGAAASGDLLTADGAGNASWAAPAPSFYLGPLLSDLTYTGVGDVGKMWLNTTDGQFKAFKPGGTIVILG